MKTITTKLLGDIEYDPKTDVVVFDEGLLGFENYRKFVLIKDGGHSEYIYNWLISLDDAGIVFPLINSKDIGLEYKVNNQEDEFYNIVSLYEGEPTVNELAPVRIKGKKGKQTLMKGSAYNSIRGSLQELIKGQQVKRNKVKFLKEASQTYDS